MRNVLIALTTVFTLAACSNYVYDLRGKFDESLTKYNNMYRWNEFNTASLFAVDPYKEDTVARVKAAKNVRIVDSRILNSRYDEVKRKATVEVEIDYYFLNTTRVKTMRDIQEWAYIEKPEVKGWRLMSPLPEFK